MDYNIKHTSQCSALRVGTSEATQQEKQPGAPEMSQKQKILAEELSYPSSHRWLPVFVTSDTVF